MSDETQGKASEEDKCTNGDESDDDANVHDETDGDVRVTSWREESLTSFKRKLDAIDSIAERLSKRVVTMDDEEQALSDS